MPGRDGTGPFGVGPLTGRGLGLGSGYGCRRGRFYDTVPSELTERDLLSAQKDLLEARLNTINKHLDKTKETNNK